MLTPPIFLKIIMLFRGGFTIRQPTLKPSVYFYHVVSFVSQVQNVDIVYLSVSAHYDIFCPRWPALDGPFVSLVQKVGIPS